VSRRVSAADRRRDLIAIGLVLGGAVLFVVAWAQMATLNYPVPVRPGQQAYPIFFRYFLMAAAGVLLILGGVGSAIWAYVRRRRRLDRGDQ
jgi:hypothetical protein